MIVINIIVFSGSGSSFSEANYKPSFLPDEELKHLVLKVNIELTKPPVNPMLNNLVNHLRMS